MVQTNRFRHKKYDGQAGDHTHRFALFALVIALAVLGASCASLVKRKDSSIPKLLTPLVESRFDDLMKQLQPFAELKSLRASQAYLMFIDVETSIRYTLEAEAILALKRPDKIRMRIQAPAIKSKIADMVSEENHFKVAVYSPSEYKRFLIGTNDADYSQWRARLGERGRSGLAEMRPFHFTEALMMRPLNISDTRFAYGIEEALVEEPDTRPGAKKDSRILRSYYVISEVEIQTPGQGVSPVRRRFWFDRASGAQFSRQQIFDDRGRLATEVYYSDYRKPSADIQSLWPRVIWVYRRHDGYSVRLTFNEDKFEIDPDLGAAVFALDNSEGLPETDLDKPPTP
jgi:hypothetical protein